MSSDRRGRPILEPQEKKRAAPDFGTALDPVTSLDFVEALPADTRRHQRRVRESPTLARRFPVKVPGTHLYELVPPLPVLEISIYRTTSFPR